MDHARCPGLLALLAVAVCVLLAGLAPPAQAYSTRVHIFYANQIHDALVAGEGTTIALVGSDEEVLIDPEDADAILSYPEYFRAGAVGPDNFMFPAMTDGTHALGQHPYDQCEILYDEAINGAERAYALGCFLHGTTDAVVHHYVNFLSGETFTLTPLSTGRTQDFDNVVRHIVAESMIQAGVVQANPDKFTGELMEHTIPYSLIMRTFFDITSDFYQLLGTHAWEAFGDLELDHPDATLDDLAGVSEFAPVEHLILIGVYIDYFEAQRVAFRAAIEARLVEMQDHTSEDGSVLLVEPGDDGMLGTYDDQTDCLVTCPVLFSEYMAALGLLVDRKDAWNDPLPPAIDLVLDELSYDIRRFPLVLVDTISQTSAVLNAALAGPDDPDAGSFNLSPSTADLLFAALDQWSDDVTVLDTKTLTYSVAPDVVLTIDSYLGILGVDVASILAALLAPVIDPIRAVITEYVINQAKEYVTLLVAEIDDKTDPVMAEYDSRLLEVSDPALGDHLLAHFNNSGLYAHSFNLTATTLANHDIILPFGEDEVGNGPASFDCSYTPDWSQAALCPELQDAVFPYGMGLAGLLTVELMDGLYPSPTLENSPIECHDGSLFEFGTPSFETCILQSLPELLEDPHTGSISRGYPPEYNPDPPVCQNIYVPGLSALPEAGAFLDEEPPEGGFGPVSDHEHGANTDVAPDDDSGCGAADTDAPSILWVLALLALVMGLRRRRWTAWLAAAALLGACDAAPADETPDEPPVDGALTHAPPATLPAQPTLVADPESPDGPDQPHFDWEPDPSSLGLTPLPALGEQLGDSVWHGVQGRWEGGVIVSRAIEMHFRPTDQEWAEVINPWGPSRVRRMRLMTFYDDDVSVDSMIVQEAGWALEDLGGVEETWIFEVLDLGPDVPRELILYGEDGFEHYVEGAWPAPTTGLTVMLRAFGSGPVEDAFCTSGLDGVVSSFDYDLLFAFARGGTEAIDFGTDVVAGAHLTSWYDDTDNNQFAVTNVNGFDQFGGTNLGNQYNFTAWYTGTITHPGGTLSMREDDDTVEDGVWVFLDSDVGSLDGEDLFFEVHGFLWSDATGDEPSASFPAGEVPIEVVMVRCAQAIDEVRLELRFGDGPYKKVGLQPTLPDLNPLFFPPPFFE